MEHVLTSEARKNFMDLVNRVHYGGERIVLRRRNKDVAALVSPEDLALLEALEDKMDIEDAKKALARGGKSIPLAEVKKKLGL